jgi:hypothetical protein
MSNRGKQKWREQFAGQVDIPLNQIFLLDELLRKMTYMYYREPLNLSFYAGITGTNYIGVTNADWDDLIKTFQDLCKRIRMAERKRLAEAKPKAQPISNDLDKDEWPEYCC